MHEGITVPWSRDSLERGKDSALALEQELRMIMLAYRTELAPRPYWSEPEP
jgi:hypothetical protein